ncbi:tRNA(adenine34) deaminase [Thermonema lapsum]|jgi:tRNA(adenine34) deaminase|uniref:tRNA-specific adenosine deaminase n=1 Tax=Thermonema lapsum TaxID=28195 RepID=A0A846MU11_9BACT|nr:nucleoside deaminase [Thermonema lapsum]NIK74790.1 tRNA(adenine34) deaminase [Thermonema lapsum]
MILDDAYFMRIALQEAQKAYEQGEIPVGAVLVHEQKIIAKAHNQTERFLDVTAHAEILCVTAATQALGGKYLPDCTLYVTLEPCVMCAGALAWAQLGRLVFAASDEKRGYSRHQPSILHPKTQVKAGVLEAEAAALLKSFFKKLRN